MADSQTPRTISSNWVTTFKNWITGKISTAVSAVTPASIKALALTGGTLTGALTGTTIKATSLVVSSPVDLNATPSKWGVIDSDGAIKYRTLAEAKTDLAVPTKASDIGAMPTTGGTFTGNVTGQYLTGTWLQTTASTELASAPTQIAVLSNGWVYYRTLEHLKTDLAIPTKASDIGAFPSTGGTISGNTSVSGTLSTTGRATLQTLTISGLPALSSTTARFVVASTSNVTYYRTLAQVKTDLGIPSSHVTTALYTGTLTTTWSGSGPYTQTLTISGITANDTPIVDVVQSSTTATAQAQLEAWACVDRITTAANSITAYCYSKKPTTAIPIQLKVVR